MYKHKSTFRGEWSFMSNMFRRDMRVGDLVFPALENAYVAQMALGDTESQIKLTQMSPGEAKDFGRYSILKRPDWNEVKVSKMYELLLIKFEDEELQKKLLATGDIEIVERNTWRDEFWGVNWETGEGKNTLGKLLMLVRQHYRR